MASPVLAQSAPVVSREVVQSLPPTGTSALNAALQRLAANPTDAGAMVDAGFAALEIGDIDAAVGFFSRADAADPGNPRAQAGLGAAYVRRENPYDALLMFEEAEKRGVAPAMLANDRGLAYDLVGDNASAQQAYRQALALGPNDEATRRLAVSLAISGDLRGAEAALLPLLRKRDLAAYRARAFVLAITGDAKGAQAIADRVMPQVMAGEIAPYLRYMPRLTSAQQAAAANFGRFPRAADIGKDDPRVAKYSGSTKRSASALVPSGEPFAPKAAQDKPAKDTNRKSRKKDKAKEVAVAATPEPPPPPAYAPRGTAAAGGGELPPVGPAGQAATSPAMPAAPSFSISQRAAAPPVAPRPSLAVGDSPAANGGEAAIASFDHGSAPAAMVGPAPVPSPAPAAVRVAAAPSSAPAGIQSPKPAETTSASAPVYGPVDEPSPLPGRPVAAQPVAQPAIPVPSAPQQPEAPQPEPPQPQVPVPPAPQPVSIADAFADFAHPATAPVQRASGAVDITKITPRRETPPPKEEVKPKPPANPSREWVQVATGRDLKALGFDWRRIARGAADQFKGKKAYVAKWGQTNRLVTGPFPNASAAQEFVTALKKVGVDSFTFTSDEGEEVTPLK